MTIRMDAGNREKSGKSSKRPKVLLTGGRAPVALEMARLLAAAGCEVHAAESVKHDLCEVSNAVASSSKVPSPAYDPNGFLNGLERIVKRVGIDWIVPTCEEIFYISSGLERLEPLCRVFAPPLEQLRRLHSKWRFNRRAEELGFAVPATRLLSTSLEWRRLLEPEPVALPSDEWVAEWANGFVLKPEFSRSGTHVRYIRPKADKNGGMECDAFPPRHNQERHARIAEEIRFPWVAQQYIRGRGLCTYSIAHEGELTAHAAYAVSYSVRGGACFYFAPVYIPALTEWVRTFARLERITGQIAFDFIETEDGRLYPIECNPRTTSGIHLFDAQDRIVDALLVPDSLDGTLVEPRPSARKMLALPMLALGWKGAGARGGLRSWLRDFASARDVVYRRNDPRPFRQQLLMLNEFRRIARAHGITMMEASTRDIEWNGNGEWP